MVRLLLVAFVAIVLGTIVFWPRQELASQKVVDAIMSATGEFDYLATSGIWNNKKVIVPQKDLLALMSDTSLQNILGQSTAHDNRWIEVDLSTQTLYAHDGNLVVYTFPISSGNPWTPTVTGQFRVWAKVKSQRMTGEGYDLPNVPFIQYFYQGYGIHGAYWHNDFGKPRSHGCVNMRSEDAAKLFYWTEPEIGDKNYLRSDMENPNGTLVFIHGATPTNIN